MKKKINGGNFLFRHFLSCPGINFKAKMPVYTEETICLCALNRIFGYEPRIASALLGYAGSAKDIFKMTSDDLKTALGPWSAYPGKITGKAIDEAVRELKEAERYGTVFAGKGSPGYPELLACCEDAPMGLYIRSGHPEKCFSKGRDYISIVGTRDVSEYGKDWCMRIVDAIASSGADPVIVSGLAYGTDITAHTAALEAGLDTIAVMATGTDTVYPAAHWKHAMRIMEKKGSGLVSDYPLHTRAIPLNFIRRNRIIAGIGKATILIESRIKGGGMITARQAFSYDRELYALPGRADDPLSAGCNALIRSCSATPVTSGQDLVESLGYIFRKKPERRKKSASDCYDGKLDKHEVENIALILRLIRKYGKITLQELTEETGFSYKAVAGLAGILENDGFISIDLMQRCSISRKNS